MTQCRVKMLVEDSPGEPARRWLARVRRAPSTRLDASNADAFATCTTAASSAPVAKPPAKHPEAGSTSDRPGA
jgi:hypothetical protein